MTTKDFQHRLRYYERFTTAFVLFYDGSTRDHIWKILIFDSFGVQFFEYSLSPYVVPRMFVGVEPECIYVKRYSRSRFDIDLKYFKSFVSKLSDYQLLLLKSDSRFTNLLNFISDEKK